jgi:hypothetical protein
VFLRWFAWSSLPCPALHVGVELSQRAQAPDRDQDGELLGVVGVLAGLKIVQVCLNSSLSKRFMLVWCWSTWFLCSRLLYLFIYIIRKTHSSPDSTARRYIFMTHCYFIWSHKTHLFHMLSCFHCLNMLSRAIYFWLSKPSLFLASKHESPTGAPDCIIHEKNRAGLVSLCK